MIKRHTQKEEQLKYIQDKVDLNVEVLSDNEIKFLLEYIYVLKQDNEILFNMVINSPDGGIL